MSEGTTKQQIDAAYEEFFGSPEARNLIILLRSYKMPIEEIKLALGPPFYAGAAHAALLMLKEHERMKHARRSHLN